MAQNTIIKKDKLVEILTENRTRHRRVFEAALEGYKAEAEKRLTARLAALQSGRLPDFDLRLIEPVDHTRDYDRVLRMIDLDIGDTWEMTERDVAQYVEDDWIWKRQFLRFSSNYAAEETERSYDVAAVDYLEP